MDEFNEAIEQIGKKNSSEVNGPLSNYFSVVEKANGRYGVVWGKAVSTHIRHKVEVLVKKHYLPKAQ